MGDPMYVGDSPYGIFNPDVSNYDITKAAVFLITGSKDKTEPENSSWKNFQQLSTPDKIHVNFKGDDHMEISEGHHEAAHIAYFCRYHALGDVEARDKIYGTGPESLSKSALIAPHGAYQNGAADIPFLACSSEGLTVPAELAGHCPSPSPAPTPPPSPSPSPFSWTKHAGVNCYGGAGAAEIDKDDYGQMSISECQSLCEGTSGCTGITVTQDTVISRKHSCLRRKDIRIKRCDTGTEFDTYTLAQSVSV